MKIVVLAGGFSPERDVSLTSGSLIANALIRKGHRVCLLDAFLGKPLTESERSHPDSLFSAQELPLHHVGENPPDLDALRHEHPDLLGENVLFLCRAADLVFIGLHGAMGENGQLQATLEIYGIPYTGSDYVGSLLSMDKDLSKQLLARAGIRTPDWLYFTDRIPPKEEILARIGLPCVVKPCACGSSVGVTMVHTESELHKALALAEVYGNGVLIEKMIAGREITVGILDRQALPAIEIIPRTGFYDYANKYQAGRTTELCPAPLTPKQASDAAAISLSAFEVLRLRGYARFDYIMDADGVFWCLEANTLPGMTPTSLLPQMAAAARTDYDTLCEKIALLAQRGK